jgi:hypothetical protein
MRRTFRPSTKVIIMLLFTFSFCLSPSSAQAPNRFSYQAVVRNAGNALVQSSNVGFKISILQGSVSGTVVYSETQVIATNANGLASLEIGSGSVVSGTFSTIDWSGGPYFLKTETDPAGGTSYTITGTTQLLSVPYALHAKTVTSYPETDPIVKAINGIVKSNGTTISAAVAGDFPVLNQNTTGSAATFTGSLVGEVTGIQGATVVSNAAVINKLLTGYASGAGTVAATDNILQAIQKLNGNNPAHYVGENYGGGIVFYVFDNGKHGLIASTSDQSTGIVWTTVTFQSIVSNAVRDGISGGHANTERIIIQAGAGSYAAQLCANHNGGSYADWYLPSKYELNLLYLQKSIVGGFANVYYWSSTENDNGSAWGQAFNTGIQALNNKFGLVYVRAIRAF